MSAFKTAKEGVTTTADIARKNKGIMQTVKPDELFEDEMAITVRGLGEKIKELEDESAADEKTINSMRNAIIDLDARITNIETSVDDGKKNKSDK